MTSLSLPTTDPNSCTSRGRDDLSAGGITTTCRSTARTCTHRGRPADARTRATLLVTMLLHVLVVATHSRTADAFVLKQQRSLTMPMRTRVLEDSLNVHDVSSSLYRYSSNRRKGRIRSRFLEKICRRVCTTSLFNASSGEEDHDSEGDSGKSRNKQQQQSDKEDAKILDELVRVKLENDHKKSFLRSRPRKLPYEDARRWVQANLGVDTKEEFEDLIENGNLRTPYIPKRPEEYYSVTSDWISWDHFLHGLYDSNSGREPPSNIKPASGAFD